MSELRLPFFDDDPSELLERCNICLRKWREHGSNGRLTVAMEKYKMQRALNLVWASNELEGTLPHGLSQREAYPVLESLYSGSELKDVLQYSDKNTSESGKNGKLQLCQHLLAYKELCESGKPLSEGLIKKTHRVLMNSLQTEEGDTVNAGEYRQMSVRAGFHAYPQPELIPGAMRKIVEEYECKAVQMSHDPHELASWLLYQVVTIHPFEDGNGRTCRLLACYSLMRDGLPFPVSISSGHKKSFKHFVWCLKKDCDRTAPGHPHLKTLITHSVSQGWSNFHCHLDCDASISKADIGFLFE